MLNAMVTRLELRIPKLGPLTGLCVGILMGLWLWLLMAVSALAIECVWE